MSSRQQKKAKKAEKQTPKVYVRSNMIESINNNNPVSLFAVGIDFADNDFWQPVSLFCKIFGENNCNEKSFHAREWRELILNTFNESVFGLYLITSAVYASEQSKDSLERTKKWLKTKEDCVFINEECYRYQEHLQNQQWGNGEYFFWDRQTGSHTV